MKSALAFIICVWLGQSVQGQLIGSGTCPNVKPALQFYTSNAFSGKWYQYARYTDSTESGTKCNTITYKRIESGLYNFENAGYKSGSKVSIKGTATASSDNDINKFTVKYSNNVKEDQIVLATDFYSYAVVWSCKNTGSSSNAQRAWILTRDQKPAKSVVDTAYTVLTSNKLSTSGLTLVGQSNCLK